jgi:sRNA-binding protein
MRDSLYYRLRPAFEQASPCLFGGRGCLAVPAKLGINREVVDLMAGTMSGTTVRNFLWRWFSRPEYLAAVAKGGQRFDLEGRACGIVSDDERSLAEACLIEKLARECVLHDGSDWAMRTMEKICADASLREKVAQRISALRLENGVAAHEKRKTT